MSKQKFDPNLLHSYQSALKNVWGTDQHMIDYCMKKTDDIVGLPNGMYFTIEKQGIEKDFCFGYSLSTYDSEDYDNANRMAARAAKDQEYFIKQNMRHFTEILNCLNEHGKSCMTILYKAYPDYNIGKLSGLNFSKMNAILDDQGGSANIEEIKGTTAQHFNHEYYILTDEDVEIVKSAIARAMERHEKKVRAYLKRFGMSKVHTWSYWQDE